MSKWLPVFLCCFAVNAFASSADSGRCPWKMPFTIKVHASGILRDTGYGMDHWDVLSDSQDLFITINACSFIGLDTLVSDTLGESLKIVFVPNTDSIKTLR